MVINKHNNAVILDGKAVSCEVKEQLRNAVVPDLKARYGRVPCLCVVIVGEDPASQVYVRNKVKAAQYVGMDSRLIELPVSTTEPQLLKIIEDLNKDAKVDGVLVQLPLPEHIDETKITDAIAPAKDVDGFNIVNVGALCTGKPCSIPCTPKGIMRLLEDYGIDVEGKNAVVIGRSNIVGKPMARLLLQKSATVTIAHSHTHNLKALTLAADILVVAVGQKALVTADMVKPGAIILDVGMNRTAEGKLCGDVDYEDVSKVAGYISPVPGGVGPMTVAMLLCNTVESFTANMCR